MAEFWQIVEHYRVTMFSGMPTVYAGLPPVSEGVDISSLRFGAVGAGPLPARVRADFESATGVPMVEGYGLTEAACAPAANPVLAPRAGSVGLRLPYQQVKAVTLDTDEAPVADLPIGSAGALVISGPSVFPGYLRPGPDGPVPDPAGKIFDGWLVTGDLGRVDAEGYVYLTGRAKDLIIRGGHNIDPRPIEEALLAHPDVVAAAVIGAPDAHAGEVPAAYLILVSGAEVTLEELHAWAADHAPEPAAVPRAIHLIEQLPTTSIGKVYKPALVLDSVERVVHAEMKELGLSGAVSSELRDGRPHVAIALGAVADGAQHSQLADVLGSYSFTCEFRKAS